MTVALIAEQVFLNGGLKFGIAADLDLTADKANGAEVFRQAFVEPSLRGRVIEVEQAKGKIAGDGAVGLVFKQVQDDEVLICAGEQESGSGDWLALAKGSGLVVGLVVFERENRQRPGFGQVVFAEQARKDRA